MESLFVFGILESMALFPLSTDVELALRDLDMNDAKLRTCLSRVFNPYKHWSYNDVFILGIVNRSMSLIYGFTTLVRSNNYYSAHHLIRLHLDSFIRFTVIWLAEDSQAITKMVFDGAKLNEIPRTRKKFYTDSFFAERAMKDYRWVQKAYDDLSGFIHLSSSHVFNAMETMDEERRSVGFHGSKYDMTVTDKTRLDGIGLMQLITNAIYDLIDRWCVDKEKKLALQGENTVPDEWHPYTLSPMKEFTYQHKGTTHMAAVTAYKNPDGDARFRVIFTKSKGVIIGYLGTKGKGGKLIWVQEMRNGITEEPHDLIQVVGEGIELCDWWVDPMEETQES